MARDLNRVFLIGRLGTDADLRHTPTGKATTNFRLAVNRRTRGGDDGQERDQTDWFTVVLWEGLAEIAAQYLGKGARIHIEGRLQTRSFETQEGQRRTITEIVGSDMIMLDTRQPADRSAGDRVEEIDIDDPSAPF